jgi:hypothetical protein
VVDRMIAFPSTKFNETFLFRRPALQTFGQFRHSPADNSRLPQKGNFPNYYVILTPRWILFKHLLKNGINEQQISNYEEKYKVIADPGHHMCGYFNPGAARNPKSACRP